MVTEISLSYDAVCDAALTWDRPIVDNCRIATD
jgi:hypothetical protein